MKVKEFSPYVKDGKIDLFNRIQGTLKHGFDWYTQIESQYIVTAGFGKALGSRFILINNLTLAGAEIPIPQVLIGPMGVRVILASPIKGVFQAKDEEWLEMRGSSVKAARPNLIRNGLLMTRALERYFTEYELGPPLIEPVLIFTHPGMYVETIRPAARVVLLDAIERYGANLAQAEVTLAEEAIYNLAEALTNPPKLATDELLAELSEEDIQADLEAPEPDAVTKALTSIAGQVNFTTRQWAVLGAIAVGEICLALAFIILVLTT